MDDVVPAAAEYEAALTVDVDYSQFSMYLEPAEVDDDGFFQLPRTEPSGPVNGMETPIFQSAGTTLTFIVGREYGDLDVEVRILQSEPPLDPAAEDIVELSRTAGADNTLTGWGGSGPEHPLPLADGVDYRFRYSVRGADTANVDTGDDAYRVEIWPAPSRPPRVMRSTSDWMGVHVTALSKSRALPRRIEGWFRSTSDPTPRWMVFVDGVSVTSGPAPKGLENWRPPERKRPDEE